MLMADTPILITGMKHSGKSTARRIIADELATDFTDLDDTIEQLYSAGTGRILSTREIYRLGKSIFQDYEVKAAETLARRRGIFTAAAGGGICDNASACARLREFTWVYIDENPRLLFERIIRGGIPAFLDPEDPFSDFIKVYDRRTAIYDKLCNIKITAGGRGPADICVEIIEKLTEAGYGRK